MSNVMLAVAVQATLLLIAVFALTLLLRRAAATTRHLVWTIGLVAVLFVPAFAALPGWHLPVAVPWAAPMSELAPVTSPEPAALSAQTPLVPVDQPCDSPETAAPATPDSVRAMGAQVPAAAPPVQPMPAVGFSLGTSGAQVVVLWLTGAVCSLLAIVVALVRLTHLRRRCLPIAVGPMHQLAQQLATELGMRRTPRLVLSAERAIPMTWGIVRPTLLMPAEAAAWPPDRLPMVLLHELGHIARWDCLTHLLGHLARCLYWFHPLAWWALAQQRREQEKACDDIVLAHGAAADQYAEHLLALTAQLPAGYLPPSLALGMARTSRLRDRLAALLDPSRRRSTSPARRLV